MPGLYSSSLIHTDCPHALQNVVVLGRAAAPSDTGLQMRCILSVILTTPDYVEYLRDGLLCGLGECYLHCQQSILRLVMNNRGGLKGLYKNIGNLDGCSGLKGSRGSRLINELRGNHYLVTSCIFPR